MGLKGYFGDEGKSVIDRHRQDDPRNRVLDLFSAAAALGTPETELTPEEQCEVDGGTWDLEYDYDPETESYIPGCDFGDLT